MQYRHIIITTVLIGGALLCWLLPLLGMPKEVAFVVVAGIYTFSSVELYSSNQEKKRAPKKLAGEIRTKRYRHPLLVFVSALAMIEIIWNAFAFIIGFATGLTLGPDLDYYYYSYLQANSIVTAAIMAFVVTGISMYVSHRIRKLPLLWTIGLIITNQFLLVLQSSWLLTEGLVINQASLLTSLTMIAILLPGVVIGHIIARKTQDSFTIVQLSKRLSKTDKAALIDLVDSLPSAKHTKP